MNVENKEKLSILVDDELGLESNAWLSKLGQDAELKRQWSRYHQIGDLMRGHTQPDGKLDLSSRVAAALQQEPAIFAPAAVSKQFTDQKPQSWLKSLAGVAIAATVATVAILGLKPAQESPTATSLASIEPQELAAVQQQEALPTTVGGMRWDMVKPVQAGYQVENSLNNYLVNHNEYATSRGRDGMMSYVRIAGYDTEQQ